MALNARQIAEIAEAAFRRGYQQGYTDGIDMVETVDLHDWRYSEPLEMAVSPLADNPFPAMSSLGRLWMENGRSFELLRLPNADD